MDFLDSIPLPAALALLALLDGLSVGTLLIPVFLLIAPGRPRVARIMLYLGTITLFYLAIGVLFTLGLVNVVDAGREFLDSALGQTALLVVGLALLAGGILTGIADSRRRKEAAARATAHVAAGSGPREAGAGSVPAPGAAAGSGPLPETRTAEAAARPPVQPGGRILRWRDRLLADRTSRGAVIGVALAAGLVEVASMLPYLLGMTMLADAPLGMPARFAMLAGYCLVMILPALVLLAARIVAARAVDRPLRRLADWLQRTGAENTAWIMGIIGFLLARAGATQLGIDLPVIG
ncbi:GAP family protein [Leucobacter sp. CSA1]|uniref:GAP family protein n=1 Tax=Leucobacter chromiisoli TaxID=2796471 RepID=A0A934QAU6_9MICO|nr:GAP family protein [Leucobacter chromiisoli]MBK0419707.1 GAP family protein [Leucobacter chromiisoli]